MKFVWGFFCGSVCLIMAIFVAGKSTMISIDEIFDAKSAQRIAAHMEYVKQESQKTEELQNALLSAFKEERTMKTILYIMLMHRHEDVDKPIADLHQLISDDVLSEKFGWTKENELKIMLFSYMAQRDRCELQIKNKKTNDADRAVNQKCKEMYETKISSAFDQFAQMSEH